MNSSRARRLALLLILTLVGVEFVRRTFGTFSVVDGVSMYPTFRPNDIVHARTLYAEAQRGEVVILTDDQGCRMIKRVVGMPGETVALYRGFVYINNERLHEPYLPRNTYTFKRNQEDERVVMWQLTHDEYFLLGDNRLQSTDSRHYGPVARSQISLVVNIPANAARPGFSGIILYDTKKVFPDSYNHHSNGHIRPRPRPKISDAKS
ncbi:MAG: signal peptidase I [Verrucomicrobia bacterium]|nr:signal peptidase I [Verrucomicrobiota bacterium]